MKKNINIASFLIIMIISFFSFISCATTLRVEVTRPSNLNLNNAKTIAVLPFEKGEYSPFDYIFDYEDKKELDYFEYYGLIDNTESYLISYIKSELENELKKSNYITLKDSIPVLQALKYGTPLPVDAFITGEVVSFKIHDLVRKEKVELPESDFSSNDNIIESTPAEGNGNPPIVEKKEKPSYYYEFSYVREVQFIFNYQIMDGRTKETLGYDTVKIERMSDVYKDKSMLPDIFNMIVDDIDSFVMNLMKDIQPYNEYKAITLLEDNTKNPLMKEADKLAKDNNYRAAYNSYLAIYNEIHQFEAGYNASMLLMALGDLKGAELLMNEVYETFGNPKALEGLNDIRNEIKQATKLNKQLSELNNEPIIINN